MSKSNTTENDVLDGLVIGLVMVIHNMEIKIQK
jgi:hypothetical protein